MTADDQIAAVLSSRLVGVDLLELGDELLVGVSEGADLLFALVEQLVLECDILLQFGNFSLVLGPLLL